MLRGGWGKEDNSDQKPEVSVHFYCPPLTGGTTNPEDLPDSSGSQVKASSAPVQKTTCNVCFPELGLSGGKSSRSKKQLLCIEHDCSLAGKGDRAQSSSSAKSPGQDFDQGVLDSSPNTDPCILLLENLQRSSTRTPDLLPLNIESYFPRLSQSALTPGTKRYPQPSSYKTWTSSHCRGPLGVLKDHEVIGNRTSALQPSSSNSNLKATPIFPHELELLGGQKDSLVPYQIHAIKFLLQTAPHLFTIGVDSVRNLLNDWDNAK